MSLHTALTHAAILRFLIAHFPGHDEPMPGAWFCGRCPYMNSGVICTKCGAPRYEGSEMPGVSDVEIYHER